jgi:Flp pilus assembly protein TadG
MRGTLKLYMILKTLSRNITGAALVEFAMTMPVLVVLAFGIADYGLLMNNTTVLVASARSGAEIVKSNPTITTSQMTALFPSGATIQPLTTSCWCITGSTVTPCPPAPGTSPCAGEINPNTGLADSRVLEYITVTATENYTPMSGISWGLPTSISSTAVARIQ